MSTAARVEIQARNPLDATLMINLYVAMMTTLQTLLTLYQVIHSQPVTHTQIVEIFNQTTNYIINMPPGH